MAEPQLEAYLESAPDDPGPYHRLDLTHANGYVPQAIDIGFPTVRENLANRPDANGAYDYTLHHGASAVQLVVAMACELVALPTTDRKLEDNLRRWLAPNRRSHLVYRAKGETEWRMVYLRGNQLSRQLNLAKTEFGEVSMTWRAPRGISESYEVQEKQISFGGVESGRNYDLIHDRVYPASGVIGTAEVFNAGSVEAYPTVRVYGPCQGVSIENQTQGKTLRFKSTFAIAAFSYLEINFENATVLLDGDSGNSRYGEIDPLVSDWWSLSEGENLLRALADSYTAPQAHVEVYWRHAYI